LFWKCVAGGVEKYSADAMRFSLADAGDSLEDANFAEDTAFNIVPRLVAQKDWIKVFTHSNSFKLALTSFHFIASLSHIQIKKEN
jgi:leucyl-tRNA synthetase